MIPLPLYVSIELMKVGQVFFIVNDIELYDPESDRPMEVKAMNISEDLGQIQYIFSDKTGTLTENKMDFRRCSIGGLDYAHQGEPQLPRAENDSLKFQTLWISGSFSKGEQVTL